MKCVHVVLKLTIQANTVIKYSGIFTTTMFIFFYFIDAIICELMKMEWILVCYYIFFLKEETFPSLQDHCHSKCYILYRT